MAAPGFLTRRLSSGAPPLGGRRGALGILFALALLAAGALAAPPRARAAKEVTLILNWLPGGAHVPLFYAHEAGFYKRAGLDVKILSERGSREALGTLHSGRAHFALAEAAEVFSHRAGGIDLLGVMVYFARSPNAVLTLKRPDIGKLADLADKKIAAPRSSFPRLLFPELKSGGKVDLARVRWQDLTPEQLLPALIEGKVDAVAASTLVAHQYRLAASQKGRELALFPYAEAGVNPYSLLLVSMDSVLAKDGPLVRSFVQATAEGLAAAIARPREALQAFLKSNPALGPERIGDEWREALLLIYPPEARRAGLGRFEEARLDEMQALLGRVRNLRLDAPLSKIFTNDFVPLLRPSPGSP